MSELKATRITMVYDGEIYDDFGTVPCSQLYYRKSEADKVIAELKEKHKTEVKELLCLIRAKENNFNRAFDSLEKEIRHQKFKRCLDNAEICCEKKENCYNRALRKYSKGEADYLVSKSDFWEDWEFRWMNLAEKFKELK